VNTDIEAWAYVRRWGLDELFLNVPESTTHSGVAQVEPTNQNYPQGWSTGEPYPIEWADLVRLFALVRLRRVTKVLEFGCGYSTAVIAHGLARNEADHGSEVRDQLRRAEPFMIHAVDAMPQFIDIARRRLGAELAERVQFHHSAVRMTEFAGRICTSYDTIPNICPDLIYLDGPDQHEVEGSISGISTRHFDRWPLACDILKIEHFLLPGTLILVDGRTANARFLKSNLQREWRYEHDQEGDVHYFEMIEDPLGKWNRRQIEFCLGEDWRARPLRPDYSRLTD
jgi:hypothetical protein